MLTYLQGNTCPEISMATHQLAQFCQDPRLSHEQATTRLGRYLAHTKERGIVYEPDKSMGIECYVDANFAGGWNITTSTNADNVMSRTGFVTTYANCPIYWASHLQTKNSSKHSRSRIYCNVICITQSDTTYDTYERITYYLSSAHKQTKLLL
jgi:hypothetical protein